MRANKLDIGMFYSAMSYLMEERSSQRFSDKLDEIENDNSVELFGFVDQVLIEVQDNKDLPKKVVYLNEVRKQTTESMPEGRVAMKKLLALSNDDIHQMDIVMIEFKVAMRSYLLTASNS